MTTSIVETHDEAFAKKVIAALSAVVVLAVALVVWGLPGRGAVDTTGALPAVNATLNGSAAVFLTLGFIMVKTGRLQAHRRCMLSATAISGAFLVTYLIHHAQVGSVPFRGSDALRPIYFAILVPHIILAAVIVPLALLTLFRGLSRRFDRHRKIARVTLPLWLYVSVSGVAVYWLQSL